MSTKSYPRAKRVGQQIQRALSELIRRELRDPRLGMVTLTDVRMSYQRRLLDGSMSFEDLRRHALINKAVKDDEARHVDEEPAAESDATADSDDGHYDSDEDDSADSDDADTRPSRPKG